MDLGSLVILQEFLQLPGLDLILIYQKFVGTLMLELKMFNYNVHHSNKSDEYNDGVGVAKIIS